MLLTVTLNPSVDHALFIDRLQLGDTNRVQRVERDAGGKGVNLSRVFAELGGRTTATGFLGGGAGAYVRCILDKQGVIHDFVETKGETRVNFSVEDDSETPPTTFNERGPTVTDTEWKALLEKVEGNAAGCRWAAIGGSIPPGVPIDAFRTIGTMLEARGVQVLLDADGEPLMHGLAGGPDFLKPNVKEASRLLGRPVESDEETIAAAKELYERIGGGDRIVAISRGEAGAALVCASGTYLGESPEVEAKSTIGAGDSFLGGMLWAMEEGKPMEEALRWGLAAGVATATTDGSEIARRAVIERLFPLATVRRL